jgi:hypothetical protein
MNKQLAASGMKFDAGKPPMELLDAHALAEVALVLAHGEKKYAADNWREGISYRRLIGAALRHVMAIADGEDMDQDSGRPHAAHAMCEMMFLLWMMKYRPDLDDRTARAAPRSPLHLPDASQLEMDLKRVVDQQYGSPVEQRSNPIE